MALPGTEEKIGVIQGGAVQTKITRGGQTANQNFYIKKNLKTEFSTPPASMLTHSIQMWSELASVDTNAAGSSRVLL